MPESYSESALRHSADADRLAASSQFDGAGYLIGYAVECAIKQAIIATRSPPQAPRVHLPDLVEQAKKVLKGRRSVSMSLVLHSPMFMHGWQIELRYAGDGAVAVDQFQRWRKDANRALAAANLRRQK